MNTEEAVAALCELIRSDLVPAVPAGASEEAWQTLERIGEKATGLSGGEQAILRIARTIWNPFVGQATLGDFARLDPDNRRAVLRIVTGWLLDGETTDADRWAQLTWWGSDCLECGNATHGDMRCDSCGKTETTAPLFMGTREMMT